MSFVDPKTPISSADSGAGSGSATNTAVTLVSQLARPAEANMAVVQFVADSGAAFSDSTAIARVRLDGGAPTTSEGFLFGDKDFLELKTVAEINQLQLISAEGSNRVNIYIQYYKAGF